MLPKIRGKLVFEDLWITTDEITHEDLFQAIERGEIDEESIGVFSGYLDVTGKEIYSGDIVRDKVQEDYEVLNDGSVCILDNHQEEPEDRYKIFEEVGMEVTIIGNMYDNSDLLS